MNTGQYIYILIAFLLFSTFSLALNRFQVASTVTTVEAQQVNDAVSLAQALVEEAWTKSFDEVTVPANQMAQGNLTFPNDFTPSNKLGRDQGESYPNFDDIDDYGDIDMTVLYGADSLHVKGSVSYMEITTDSLATSSNTFNKILTFTITSPRNEMNLEFDYIFSYLGSD